MLPIDALIELWWRWAGASDFLVGISIFVAVAVVSAPFYFVSWLNKQNKERQRAGRERERQAANEARQRAEALRAKARDSAENENLNDDDECYDLLPIKNEPSHQ